MTFFPGWVHPKRQVPIAIDCILMSFPKKISAKTPQNPKWPNVSLWLNSDWETFGQYDQMLLCAQTFGMGGIWTSSLWLTKKNQKNEFVRNDCQCVVIVSNYQTTSKWRKQWFILLNSNRYLWFFNKKWHWWLTKKHILTSIATEFFFQKIFIFSISSIDQRYLICLSHRLFQCC